MTQIKIITHISLQGLVTGVNSWLENHHFAEVIDVTLSHDGHVHIACITLKLPNRN